MSWWKRLFTRAPVELARDDDWGSKPPARALRDIPVSNVTNWDSVTKVKSALTQLEQGQFAYAAQLVDAMGRDDRITSCLAKRSQTLLGAPLEFELSPEVEGAKAEEIRDWFKAKWDLILPEEAATDLLRWGEMLNAGVAQLVWEKGDEWIPTIKIWHPRYLRWDWSTRAYWISTMDGEVQVEPGDGTWFLYMPYGYERGWMNARVRCLAIPFLLRQFALRDWARNSEVHGLPIRLGVVPESAREEVKNRFIRELANLASESVVRVPKGANGEGFDVKLIEAAADSWEGFNALLDKAESSIAITLLGQNLTTEVKSSGGGIGQGGGSSTHERVEGKLLRSDAKRLATALRAQVLKPTAAFNFGDPELAPLPGWQTEPPEDTAARAKMMFDLAQALATFGNAGMRLDLTELADQFDLPLNQEKVKDEQTGELFQYHFDYGVVTVNEVRKRLGLPPLKGGDAPPVNRALVNTPPAGPDKSDPPSPDKKAPPEGLHVLADPQLPAQLSEGVEGQLYADAVADRARDEAARVLSVDVRKLADIIAGAESYEDLRLKLLTAYQGMGQAELADVLRRAMILAQLNGWHTAKGER